MKIFSIFVFTVFLGIAATAQLLPPIENFDPEQYGAENQNWALAQGDGGTLFIANNSGLLTYNGAQWRLYDSPNNSVMRSVGYAKGRVYTGSHMELGYWQQDNKGIYQYTTLVDKLPGMPVEDEEFWKILFVGQSVLFQSLDRICVYDTLKETFTTIDVKEELTKAYSVDGSIYFQVPGKGIYQVVNGNVQLLVENDIVSEDVVINLFRIDGELVILTQTNGFFKWIDGEMIPWEVEVNPVVVNDQAFAAIALKSGYIAVGTISSGLLICDTGGKIKMQIDQGNGLLNNTVLSLFEDKSSNIWLGLDYGISVVNMVTPFKVYRDTAGKLGTVYDAAQRDGYLYLGTNQGLFYRKENSPEADFKLIAGTGGQVWKLKSVYGTLFCGHNAGTFVVKGTDAKKISSILGTWDLEPVPNDSTLILQGNYNGLSVLEREGNGWRLRNKLDGYDISSRYLAFSGDNELLVSHEYKGVFNLKINEALTTVEKYGVLSSVPVGSKSSLTTFDGKVVYGHPNGIYVYDQTLDRFQIDSILSSGWDGNDFISGKLIPKDNGSTLWVFNKDGLVSFSPDDLTSRIRRQAIPFPSSVRQDMQGYENISVIDQNKLLIGLTGGFVLVNTNELQEKAYEIHLNRIQNSGTNLEPYYLPLDTTGVEFSANANTLAFRYHVSEFEKYLTVHYQYRLKGRSDTWSRWRSTSSVIFENLSFGDYVFEVRAKVGNTITSNVAAFAFSIARPWYISITAIVIYCLILLAVLLSIYVFTRYYYKRQHQKLVERNKVQLEKQRYQNERELLKVKNEKLQVDFDSKSRELAASAMSIVKKNELLSGIKKELEEAREDEHVHRVIKILDKNLNTNKDWEFFEEAFNNADKDFLQQMKSLHPKLTPNDLKLCAYLRLNLSSKEIAPLLNISVRSVEIKRYRLRKKMDLEHEQSLVEYILSI